MLRVLKASSLCNSRVVHPQWTFLRRRKLKCSLCDRVTVHALVEGTILFRSNSTGVPAILLHNETKAKKIQKKTKYIDLLEVSTDKTTEKRAKIRRLNANSLLTISDSGKTSILPDPHSALLPSECSEQFDIKSDEFENEHRRIEMDQLEELDDQPFDDTQKPPSHSSINGKDSSQRSLPSDYREKVARIKLEDLDKAGKEKCLNSTLVSYVELCMSCGFLNRAWFTVNHYLNKKNVPITDIRIFNTLFEAFARNGKIDRLTDVWQVMIDVAKLEPNAVSFARRIEAIARSQKKEKKELIHSCLQMMEKQGISLDKIFMDTDWRRDSREVVLLAIRIIHPSYSPKIVPPTLEYDCHLINNLNTPPARPLVSPAESMFNEEDLKKLFKEQFTLEMNTYVKVSSIEAEKQKNISSYTQFCRDQLEKLESEWDNVIHSALKRDLATMCAVHKNTQKNSNPVNIYPYLTVLNRSDYVDIIKHEIRKLAMGSETYSPTTSFLCKDIGNMVKLRYDIKSKQSDGILKKMEKIYDGYSKWYLNPENEKGYSPRQAWQLISAQYQEGPSLDAESEPWPTTVLTAVGKFLYNIILRDVKVDVNVLRQNSKSPHLLPAFYTVFRYQANTTCQEVKPHPVLSKLFRLSCLPHLVFSASDLPMLSPPLPWVSIRSGGYLIAKAPIIRLPSSASTQRERLKEASSHQLFPCFDSLNQLGSVPWRVNTNILDIVISLFNGGGNEKLNIPPPPPPSKAISLPEEATKTEKYEAFRARMLERRKRAEMYSLWCDALYRLSLANHYRDRVFWLPHNMDFRGRVYPCPPHLSHLGSDLYRSLLVFAKKQLLGAEGLNWLKLHAINLTGLKKRESVAARLKYAEEVLPQIIDSANNPLKKGAWWTESEEPWQTLATCFEIRDALAHPGGPEAYESSFPVHQDGSCNGLQHYAALGRDASGAASVNLAPAEVPQDVYSCVAAIVDRERAKDAQNGDKVAQILEGFVRRKVIKQTVMTTVYGVTRFGARLQIAKQLKDIDDFPKEYVWAASQYLVIKTFDSIREMFTSTREIQDWFTEAAHLIAGVRGESVEYITPLGLPVVQPYSRSSSSKSNTTTSGKVSFMTKFDQFQRPNVMKQKNAFPPNFIHSLDSTHMMLTSLHCQRAGITFVSVHDCFWTHPSTVNVMNKICREQFVALHSQPILQDLSEFMLKRYAFENDGSDINLPESVTQAKKKLNSLLKKYPSRGNFQLENVLDSVYFFS